MDKREQPPKIKKKFSIFPWEWDNNIGEREPRSQSSRRPVETIESTAKPPAVARTRTKIVKETKVRDKEKKPAKTVARSRKEVIYDATVHQEPVTVQTHPGNLVPLPPSPSVNSRNLQPSPQLSSRSSLQKLVINPPAHLQTTADNAKLRENVLREMGKLQQNTIIGKDVSNRVPIWSQKLSKDPMLSNSSSFSQIASVGRSAGSRNRSGSLAAIRMGLPTFGHIEHMDEEDDDFEPTLNGTDSDLTFEKAVLALIRLRRVESRLARTRDRYTKEMGMFRGWDDERYMYVLDQIAKCNLQMDELDPLIASLEAFIKEDQIPHYLPEDQVLRYPPLSADSSRLPVAQKPPKLLSESVGRKNGCPPAVVPRSTLLLTQQMNSEELEQEVEELRQQVRQLQMEKRGAPRIVPLNDVKPQNDNLPIPDVRSKYSEWKDRSADGFLDARKEIVPRYSGMCRLQGQRTMVSTGDQHRYESQSDTKTVGRQRQQSSVDSERRSEPSSDDLEVNSVTNSVEHYEDFNTRQDSLRKDLKESFSQLDDLMRDVEKGRRGPVKRYDLTRYEQPKYSPVPVRRIRTAKQESKNRSPAGDEVHYELQMRLESPEPICIPERYMGDEESETAERETAFQAMQRREKAEKIRRRLAQPEFASSERDQRDREKVLMLAPILAREVKERSRNVALQSQAKILR